MGYPYPLFAYVLLGGPKLPVGKTGAVPKLAQPGVHAPIVTLESPRLETQQPQSLRALQYSQNIHIFYHYGTRSPKPS